MSDAADQAFDESQKSPRRTIITNDFQLRIIRDALVACPVEEFTAAQNYEVGMLVGMIDDVLTHPAGPEDVHGFVH